MKLLLQPPKRILNKAFLKQRPLRNEMDLFKAELITLLNRIDTNETEEFHKNLVSDFLKKALYPANFINTKGRQDLVIHNGKDNKTSVGVIIEAKRPSNKSEWFTADKPNGKALQELLLYYLRERIESNNIDIKYVVATNINEWFIIEASYFERLFYRNKQLVKHYEEWRDGKKVTRDTNLFYTEIAKPFIDSLPDEIPCTWFNIQDYVKILKNENKADDKNLIALLKILSPQHLLKVPFANDSNELDRNFYTELLHIIGMEEAKEGGKNIIRRKKENKNAASLLEMVIKKLKTKGTHKLSDIKAFGETTEEQHFNIALELCITWINRILFLKLLEGQLVSYHKGDRSYCFLNSEMIHDFDELFKLFHSVLAVNVQDREDELRHKYRLVPYLNSSLFEISELEDLSISIDSLDNSETFDLKTTTILKEHKKKNSRLKTLDYLFQFLDAYDFASEGAEDIQEDTKPLINASVLGKVFEKINGYKDGSIYTPGFITMYMCRQSIRLAVTQKFIDAKNWDIKNFDELYNKIDNIEEANKIIDDLKICDPAVGSGHFLVSALNEIIAIKSELKILKDKNGKRLKEYTVEVENDELYITDEDGEIFEYIPQNKESQRIQETLFYEKQTIIENCLFGVDINPNSVKICRLRLWIELLKNAYYKKDTDYRELETLPNIDINIKCGNSLLSRFPLDADLSKALKSIKYDIKAYRDFVNAYKNERNRDVKKGFQIIINSIKSDFRTEIFKNDPKVLRLNKVSGELFSLLNQTKLFDEDAKQKKVRDVKQEKLEAEIKKLATDIEEIKTNAIYKNAFEWRFEFPEVLNNVGDFEGFDLVIGNPPYIRAEALGKEVKKVYNLAFQTSFKQYDILVLFFEKGIEILKNKGPLSFIVSNKFLISDYGAKLRKYILYNTIFTEAVDISYDDVFKEVSVYPYIISLKKEKDSIKREKNEIIFRPSVTLESSVKISQSFFMNEENQVFDFTSFKHFWMKKAENGTIPLGELIHITRGFRPPKEELKVSTAKGEKYLIGKDLKGAYDIRWSGNRVLYYAKEIEESKPLSIFKKPKILFRDIGLKFNAAYDENGLLCLKTIYFGYSINYEYNLKFLIALLNSKLINEYFSNKYSISHISGGYLRFRKQFVQNIPIKKSNIDSQRPFIDIVDKIIEAKEHGKDIIVLEKEIDKLVYVLYGISEQEQKIIEGS